MATGRRSQAQAQALVTVHLVAFAHVTLHRPFVSTYKPSQKRCIEAAFGVVRVLDQMSEMGVGVGSQSPIYAVRLLSAPKRGYTDEHSFVDCLDGIVPRVAR